MAHIMQPGQRPIGTLANQQTAEAAIKSLQESGFPVENLELLPESPAVPETQAKENGAKGAIAGALFGGLMGLFLSYAKLYLADGTLSVDPVTNMIGMALAGSLIGAVGVGIMAAITGVNVRRTNGGNEAAVLTPRILVMGKNLQAAQLQQLRERLQHFGGEITELR